MGKHHSLPDFTISAILVDEPLPIFLNRLAKSLPISSKDMTTLPPTIRLVQVFVFLGVFVKPGHNLLGSICPLVPVLPYERPILFLLLSKFHSFVKFPHALRDLFRGLWHTEIFCSKRPGMQELLESAIGERPEQFGTDVLTPHSPENLQFRFSVNEVLDLGTIDAEE